MFVDSRWTQMQIEMTVASLKPHEVYAGLDDFYLLSFDGHENVRNLNLKEITNMLCFFRGIILSISKPS